MKYRFSLVRVSLSTDGKNKEILFKDFHDSPHVKQIQVVTLPPHSSTNGRKMEHEVTHLGRVRTRCTALSRRVGVQPRVTRTNTQLMGIKDLYGVLTSTFVHPLGYRPVVPLRTRRRECTWNPSTGATTERQYR